MYIYIYISMVINGQLSSTWPIFDTCTDHDSVGSHAGNVVPRPPGWSSSALREKKRPTGGWCKMTVWSLRASDVSSVPWKVHSPAQSIIVTGTVKYMKYQVSHIIPLLYVPFFDCKPSQIPFQSTNQQQTSVSMDLTGICHDSEDIFRARWRICTSGERSPRWILPSQRRSEMAAMCQTSQKIIPEPSGYVKNIRK